MGELTSMIANILRKVLNVKRKKLALADYEILFLEVKELESCLGVRQQQKVPPATNAVYVIFLPMSGHNSSSSQH